MASPVRSICAASARADRHPEILHVLRRLPQGGGVDAQKGQCRPIAEEVRCHGGAFGLGHELVQRLLNGDDALVERQGLQFGGRQVQPLQGPNSRSGPSRRFRQPRGQLLGGLFDLAHRDTGQFAQPMSAPAGFRRWSGARRAMSACAPITSRPERTIATPAAAAAAVTAASAIPALRAKLPSRALASSISEDRRPNPRVPASPIPSNSART